MIKRPQKDKWGWEPAGCSSLSEGAKIKRPRMCLGCPAHPESPDYKASLTGEFVPPHGPLDADMLMIGIAPGEDEERKGEPFVGPSGHKAHTAITWALEGREIKIRKLNAVNCRTKKQGLYKSFINRNPTAREYKECAKRFLLPELQRTKAKAILTLGQFPFDMLLQRAGITYHTLPRVHHKYTFALCMGHRNVLPRRLFL